MELYTKTINLIKDIDDRATLQVLNTKILVKTTQYAVPKKKNLDWKNNTDSI